jgi:hypothetical protein
MGRKKREEQIEPLSNFQDLANTGRKEISAEVVEQKIQDARERARKAIDIRAAELKDQMFCKYRYLHNVGKGATNKINTDSEVPVHPDLVACFRRLDAHLAVVCEEVASDSVTDIDKAPHSPDDQVCDEIKKFQVTSFRLDGVEDAMSVVLSGTKELSTGEYIKLETPKISIDESYPFAMELSSTLQDAVSEIEQYMKGKQAESPQPELPFSAGEDL